MIKLNLLDDAEIQKNLQQAGAAGISVVGAPKKINWFILGPAIAGVVYLIFILYYLFGIKAPLSELKIEMQDTQTKLTQLKPKAAETQKLENELKNLKVYNGEFENFLVNKQNWAKILNILSDELPEEIIFQNISITDFKYTKKTKTDKGLLTVQIPCQVFKIDIEVPQEFQSKVAAYEKKLKTHKWLSNAVINVESTGLVLINEKNYSSSLKLYFPKSQEEKQ